MFKKLIILMLAFIIFSKAGDFNKKLLKRKLPLPTINEISSHEGSSEECDEESVNFLMEELVLQRKSPVIEKNPGVKTRQYYKIKGSSNNLKELNIITAHTENPDEHIDPSSVKKIKR